LFTCILVALDGSEVSQRALVEAVDQARIWNAKIHAIYVMETARSASNSMDQTIAMGNTFEIYRLLEKEGEAVLKGAKKYCADNGITIINHLKQGDAGIEIISLAEQERCDLIVVASHGKSNIDRLLLGSVSSFVVIHNKVSTMVVRG
jgi:nucleotide-binding universal stress UspA family protein